MLINSAFADATSDARIQAYKANKLIPQNVVLPTTTGAKDSDEVVCFNPGKLTWSSDTAGNAALAGLKDKYGDMTLDELRNEIGTSQWDWDETDSEMQEYLSQIYKGNIVRDDITPQAALAALQEQFDAMCSEGYIIGKPFPSAGIDFTGVSLYESDLSGFTDLTGAQIAQAAMFASCTFPDVQFTGTEDLSGVIYANVDLTAAKGLNWGQVFSMNRTGMLYIPSNMLDLTGKDLTDKNLSYLNLANCVGLTATQVASTSSILGTALPAINFTGAENFSGKSIIDVDFRKCTGLTSAQILSASEFYGAKLPAIQFSPTDDFTDRDASGVDFTKCTGLTATQIASASSLFDARMTSAQYNAWKDEISQYYRHIDTSVIVDGVRVYIE